MTSSTRAQYTVFFRDFLAGGLVQRYNSPLVIKGNFMDWAIETRGLKKTFAGHLSIGKIRALDGVDLEVPKSAIYGFLGPNGAGKTTMLKILTGLLKPDEGSAAILGRAVGDRNIRASIGYLPETPYFYEYLTGKELLHFFGRLFGISSVRLRKLVPEFLHLVGLDEKGDLQLRKYSKGMLQRVGLAQALLNDPELVILDEPMTGLDPMGRREIRDVILSLREQGKTVFFSSHILADAEMICDRVAILVNGRIKKQGRLDQLLGKEIRFWEVTVGGWDPLPEPWAGRTVLQREEQVLLRVEEEGEVQAIVDGARKAGASILRVISHRRSLEDLFIEQVPGAKK